jgi:dihydrofolate reductase
MRRIRYRVATSLDGYIAGPNGEADWIVSDPDIDFRAFYAQFDTMLVGRRTFETAPAAFRTPGMETLVFSRTLRRDDYPWAEVVAEDAAGVVSALRARPGKDLWLFGGGALFRSLLGAGLVDTVEVVVSPVLLGGGLPLLLPPAGRARLRLTGSRIYKTGVAQLEYAVE